MAEPEAPEKHTTGNGKYDNVTQMGASGELNWVGDTIRAVLCKGVVFDASDVYLTDAVSGGASNIASAPVLNRSLGPAGEAIGQAVTFPRTAKDTDYQVLLIQDKGRTDGKVPVLAFYDEDDTGGPITLTHNGTLILRPTAGDGITGVWFTF